MSDDETNMLKWYGWANVHTTDEVAAMLHKQEKEIARLRSVCERAAFKTIAGMPIIPKVDRETPFAVAEMLYDELKQGKEFVKEEDRKDSEGKDVCQSWMYMNHTGGWFVPTSDAGKEPSDGE